MLLDLQQTHYIVLSNRESRLENCEVAVLEEAFESVTEDHVPPAALSSLWEFSEEATGLGQIGPKLDIWVIPFGHVKAETITLIFRYFHEEFMDIAWMRAIKRFACILGLDDYTPNELLGWYHKALVTWEENVDKEPNNPFTISRLAEAYADLGDHKMEIAAWWRLFEKHPTNLSFLRMLHRACTASGSVHHTGIFSHISFTRLCTLYLVQRKAQQYGLGLLDWWPFARTEEFMIFQPRMPGVEWRNVRNGKENLRE